ncbi:MAG: hypothetical protein V3V92_06865 [Candidatus Hydrothermarchaeales archaeon]
MKTWKIFVLATAALLVVTSVGVLAQGSGEGNGWLQEMREHYIGTHGDDFEEHHQEMHGEDWEEHVSECHEDIDSEEMHTGEHRGSMMGTA